MTKFITRLIILLCLTSINVQCIPDQTKVQKLTTKIAFGSCGWENHPLPIFNRVVDHKPDIFIFLGDNIYGDTKSMDTLSAKYNRLGSKKSYQNLKANVPILATWDDHDYGWNDIGRHYAFKEESKEIFLDFFEEPLESSRRKHSGIYHSELYQYDEYTLQIILLDERTFRDDLKSYDGSFDDDQRFSFYHNDYAIHTDSDSTLLGKQQWSWLANQFNIEADIRIICSGTQFGIEWNGYEAWANFPHEQQRMIDLIHQTKANGVLFISGDVHYSEISKIETKNYPIYDFTASGLSSTWHFATPNKNRIEGPVMDNHFGLITIDWKSKPIQIKMEAWDISDNQRIEYSIGLDEISFDD